MLVVTAFAVGCSNEPAEVPKNPAPKPAAGPGASMPPEQGKAGKNSVSGEGAKKL
jgi:hypothetical protein